MLGHQPVPHSQGRMPLLRSTFRSAVSRASVATAHGPIAGRDLATYARDAVRALRAQQVSGELVLD